MKSSLAALLAIALAGTAPAAFAQSSSAAPNATNTPPATGTSAEPAGGVVNNSDNRATTPGGASAGSAKQSATNPGVGDTSTDAAQHGTDRKDTSVSGSVGDTNASGAGASTGQPESGANSFTEDQARGRIADRGFTDVNGLKLDDQSVWRGTATKGGKTYEVSLDYKGDVFAQPR